jgi:hypothetical protein
MTRRQSRPLTGMSGNAYWDQVGKRKPRRRGFRQVTLGGGAEPIPFFGRIYRMIKATGNLTDYESVSDESWSTGTTGGDNWNCFYVHKTVANAAQESFDVILNPIRFEIDGPASSGDRFDWWGQSGPTNLFTKVKTPDGRYGVVVPPSAFLAGTSVLGMIDTLMTANTHSEFQEDRLEWQLSSLGSQAFFPIRPTGARGSSSWYETTLNAIQPGVYDLSGLTTLSMKYIQHYINGAKRGDFTDCEDSSNAWWRVESVSKGDSYHFDVWFRLRYTPWTNIGSRPGRSCFYFPTTKVTGGTRRYVNQNSKTRIPLMRFANIDHTPNYNFQEETYSLTFNGHTGWTIHNGSNTIVLKTQAGTTAAISGFSTRMTFDYPHPTRQWFTEINLIWIYENPLIQILVGPTLKAQLGIPLDEPLGLGLQYRPQDSGDYVEQVTSADYGFVNVAPNGVFNQGGTTTFDLIPWSATQPSTGPLNDYANEGGGLIPSTPTSVVPTSITVTKVSR